MQSAASVLSALPKHVGTSLIDIGINLGSKQYNNDREAIVDRGVSHGVGRMIITGGECSDIFPDIQAAVRKEV